MTKTLKHTLQPIHDGIVISDREFQSGVITSHKHSTNRLALIQRGLQCIADAHQFPAQIGHCDSRGEYPFSSKQPNSQYGEALVALLNQVQTRTGTTPKKGHLSAQNNWCFINHFDARQLIALAVA